MGGNLSTKETNGSQMHCSPCTHGEGPPEGCVAKGMGARTCGRCSWLAQGPDSAWRLLALFPRVPHVLLLTRMEDSCGEESKSMCILKVRNIVVDRGSLIHSVEKALIEKVSNKDVRICLSESDSGFSAVFYSTWVARNNVQEMDATCLTL